MSSFSRTASGGALFRRPSCPKSPTLNKKPNCYLGKQKSADFPILDIWANLNLWSPTGSVSRPERSDWWQC